MSTGQRASACWASLCAPERRQARAAGLNAPACAAALNETAAKLLLGPLLLAQAWHVRRVTPRLPEADGERSGSAGSGPALRVLVTGDSSAAGVGVAHQSDALAGRLAHHLEPHFRVDWTVLAQTGLDSLGLAGLLAKADCRAHDIAFVCCGVNDVTGMVPPRQTLERLMQVRDLLHERHGVRRVVFSPVPPMHRFPALPQPLRWFMGRRAAALNQALREQVPQWASCALVDAAFTLDAAAIAADGFHPGAPAYDHWARLLAADLQAWDAASRR